MSTDTINTIVMRIVSNEVHLCLSGIVHTLAQSFGYTEIENRDLMKLAEQAFELASPIEDYESAAEDAGWHKNEDDLWVSTGDDTGYDNPEAICFEHDLEPYQREVFAHWVVSRWLGEELVKHGHKVDFDFQGLVVWARTTTGQVIYADHVIREIAKDLMNDKL